MSHMAGNMTCKCPECVNVALLSPTPCPLRPLDFPGLQTLSVGLAAALPGTKHCLFTWDCQHGLCQRLSSVKRQPSNVSPWVTLDASVALGACEPLQRAC